MQSPPKTAVFESDLAPLLSAFVAEKQRFGFKYNSIEAYLKSFDTFLLGRDCKNSLSKELMLEWIAPKAHQKSATIEHRIYIMHFSWNQFRWNSICGKTSELLKKVRHIEIKTRGLSRNIFAGQYHSAFKGRGMAFSEVREYQYGDDVRDIDWNVTARYNKPYVKVFEEEREY